MGKTPLCVYLSVLVLYIFFLILTGKIKQACVGGSKEGSLGNYFSLPLSSKHIYTLDSFGLCLIAVSPNPDLSAYLVLTGGILQLLSEVANAFLEWHLPCCLPHTVDKRKYLTGECYCCQQENLTFLVMVCSSPFAVILIFWGKRMTANETRVWFISNRMVKITAIVTVHWLKTNVNALGKNTVCEQAGSLCSSHAQKKKWTQAWHKVIFILTVHFWWKWLK